MLPEFSVGMFAIQHPFNTKSNIQGKMKNKALLYDTIKDSITTTITTFQLVSHYPGKEPLNVLW